jgi:hypothetical protein
LFKVIRKPDHYELKHLPDSKYPGKGKALLFDLDKGPGDLGDSAWMAFREDNFILNCEWTDRVSIRSVVLSSIIHTDPYLFPPESIIIRGGLERSVMQVLGKLNPKKLEERSGMHIEFYECHVSLIRFLSVILR